MSVHGAQLRRLPVTPFVPVAACALAVLSAPLAARAPVLTGAAAVATALVIAVLVHPPVAAYVLVAVTPLIVGMDRGAVLPLLRPNEAILLLVCAAVVLRGSIRWLAGNPIRVRFDRLDASLLLLVVAASALPLLFMLAKEKRITQDDVLYATVLCKYFAVYLVVRATVRTEREVRRCLFLSLAVAAAVAVVGILQALELFGVPQLLAAHYTPDGEEGALEINRAMSTLAQSFAFADFMVFNLAIAGALLLRGHAHPKHRTVLIAAAFVFAVGTLASGQFSAVLGLLVGVMAFGVITGRIRHALFALLPVLLVAGLVLQPVIEERVSSVDPTTGLPSSWEGRRNNLERYFLPELTTDFGYVFGVQASARVHSVHYSKDWVYIESGYLWLLWIGGIPLLVAFVIFIVTAMRATGRVARRRVDAVGSAAVAGFVALGVVAALTALDPHLTLRGSGDLLFSLLALAVVGIHRGRDVDDGVKARPVTTASSLAAVR